jgi:hypothetical protein
MAQVYVLMADNGMFAKNVMAQVFANTTYANLNANRGAEEVEFVSTGWIKFIVKKGVVVREFVSTGTSNHNANYAKETVFVFTTSTRRVVDNVQPVNMGN